MKFTIKQINEQIIPAVNALDRQNENVKQSVQALYNQINEAHANSNLPALQQKIAEYEDALKEIELRRVVKQLKAEAERQELDITPSEVDFEVPDGLKDVFHKKRDNYEINK